MITLSNSHLRVEIDEMCGCDVVWLGAPAGCNVLDKRGWQSWLKHGRDVEAPLDAATGVLSTFYPDSRTAIYQVLGQSATELAVVWHAPQSDLDVYKTLRLDGARFEMETRLLNTGEATSENLQIEQFIAFAGGSGEERVTHVSRLPGVSGEPIVRLEPFAQRFVKCFSGATRWEIAGSEWAVEVEASANTQGAMAVAFAKLQARGFFSPPFRLAPGESYSHRAQLRWLEGEQRRELQALTRATPPRPSRCSAQPELLNLFEGTPVFARRWSHLCLQYDQVSLDAVRRVVAELLVPLGYNGVIWEVNRGVRLHSHPELAESWSLSRRELEELVGFCRGHGLQVGLEFNTPGHQNETNLLRAHPQLAEDAAVLDRPALCVSNPQARRIVSEVIGELVESCAPDVFHFGGDEAQFAGAGHSSFGRCARCRGKTAAQLWGDWIAWLPTLLPPDVTPMMWGDGFLQDAHFGPHDGGNGSQGEIWRALERLPSHVHIADWHYYPGEEFPSLDYFRQRGHTVWPATAFDLDGIAAFVGDAQKRGVAQLLHTTWAVPSQEKLPIESMVWAALYAWRGREAAQLPVREAALEWCRNFWKD